MTTPSPAERQRQASRESLYRVSHALQTSRSPRRILRLVVLEAVRLSGATSGSLMLINPNTGLLEIEAGVGLPRSARKASLKPGQGVAGRVAQTGLPLRVADVRADPRYGTGRPGVRSELALPLQVDGRLMGVLQVDSDQRDAFSQTDEELLDVLAEHSARVLHQAWLLEKLARQGRQLETLFTIARTIVSAPSLDDTLRLITAQAARLLGGKLASLLLLDRDLDELVLKACHGAGRAYATKPNLRVSDSQVGVVVRRKRPLTVLNVQESDRFRHIELARAEGLVSLLSVPLVHGGEVMGVLNVYTGEQRRFDNEEIRLLGALANLSAVALQKARLHEKMIAEEELLRQNEKLSALGMLAAEVAHEIRNPLAVMKMLFHSLRLEFAPGDARARDARVIRDKMDQLDQIVDRILRVARTSEPRFRSEPLPEMVEEVLLLVRPKLARRRIRLRRSLPTALPPVRCDRAQIEQVLLNLILNATEAMPRGGTLTLAAAPAGQEVCLRVSDTGPGIPAAQRERLFQPFLSGKPGGTGLGLAIVRKIVEAHHGRIEVRSRQGKGSHFLVVLPAA